MQNAKSLNNKSLKTKGIKKRPLILDDELTVTKKKKINNVDTGSMIKINPITNDDIEDWNDWVAATSTRNYLLDDGILDVIETKGSALTKINTNYQDKFLKTVNNRSNNFVTSIMEQGVKFEKKIIQLIISKVGQNNVINIGGDTNPRSRDKYLNTIKAMNDGIPIIYQGILRNYKNKTYGIPDLLVLRNFLPELITKIPLAVERGAAKLPFNDHYVVIDIKFKTLPLTTDGIHLRNEGPMKAYKGQLCVYNEALGVIQGYKPSAAFIMGWKWKYVSKTIEYYGDNCFDRLGRINYTGVDKSYVEKTKKAVKWINNVRTNGHTWDLSKVPLPHPELYPNMCNQYDYPYHKLKEAFAEDIEEISLLWKCGAKHRKIAHAKGIYSWKDQKISPEMLGIGGDYTTKILSRVIEANNSVANVQPKYITNNYANWKNRVGIEFFVDFEMTCSVFTEFDDLPYADGQTLIFMIGVGCVINGVWNFKNFTVNALSSDGEYEICQQFYQYIKDMSKDEFETPSIYHWSPAEPSAWSRACNRHKFSCVLNWVDLLKVFHEEPIGVKGCLNFGLKNIAKAFHKHGYIKTIWENGPCSDGADAAIGAYKVDQNIKKYGGSFKEAPLIKDIEKYNEVDCKVLEEIITYLRKNHINPHDLDLELLPEDIMDVVLYDSSNEDEIYGPDSDETMKIDNEREVKRTFNNYSNKKLKLESDDNINWEINKESHEYSDDLNDSIDSYDTDSDSDYVD